MIALWMFGCREVLPPPDAVASSGAWEEVLASVVDDRGLVDYRALRERRAALDGFVASLAQGAAPRDRENPQHAYWLNAYNALVLWTVLEDGLDETGQSVRSVDGWLPVAGSAFFFERAYIVQGMPTSLWEIEHERLRGRVMDYRDHAALNCASRSCPPLRGELYTMKELDRQLDDQMAAWLSDAERGVRIGQDSVAVSPIFSWYAHDFELQTVGDDPCMIASRFVHGPKRDRLRELSLEGCVRTELEWDWSLNDAARD